jgi:hypothetical protein
LTGPCRSLVASGKATIVLTLVLLLMPDLPGAGEAQDTARRLVESLSIGRPDGPGPFPAIMLVPVCSGMSKKENAAHYREMAERLNGLGYLVVHVDYVAARRLTEACGSLVPPDEIARDIVTVSRHLRALGRSTPLASTSSASHSAEAACWPRSVTLASKGSRHSGEAWCSIPYVGASRRRGPGGKSSCCSEVWTA